MKKIIYFVAALIYFSCFCESKVYSQEGPKKKYRAFFDSVTMKRYTDSIGLYSDFNERFEVVPIEKFYQYHSDFSSMFNTFFVPPSFSIYGKYQNFQFNLNLQSPYFTDPATSIRYENRIRIYPAITTGNIFYLVMLRDLKDITTTPVPVYTQTSRKAYYSIQQTTAGSKFDEISPTDVTTTISDIKRFQSAWNYIANIYTPPLAFSKDDRSFSYSIIEYDRLLSPAFPYWDMAREKTYALSNVVVRIFPGVYEESQSHLMRFCLMLRLYTVNALGQYKEIPNKAIFDNIDPCPNVCPDPITDIKIP